METGPWPHLDRRQERGVVWEGRHRFLLEVPANFGELRQGEVRRITLPRTPLNKAIKKDRLDPTPHSSFVAQVLFTELALQVPLLTLDHTTLDYQQRCW